MEFEWDDAKNEASFAKHGFDFEHAIQIFDGPFREYVEPRPWGEQRIVATGRIGWVYHSGIHGQKRAPPDHFGEASEAQ